MMTTRFGWIGLAAALMLAATSSAAAQEVGSITGSPGPGVPFVTETVLPSTNVRLLMDFIPVTVEGPVTSANDFIVPFRFYGAWHMTDSVMGEASLPLLMSFPGDEGRDSGFDVGNAKFGIEWPVYSVGQRQRLSVSFDMYLPLSQIGWGDTEVEVPAVEGDPSGRTIYDAQGLADSIERRFRYSLAATLLPQLQADYQAETFTLMLGSHYRLTDGPWAMHVNLDAGAFLGFDFNQPKFFHENYFGLRYGVEASYDARPVIPSLEITGVTTFSHDPPAALPEDPEQRVPSEILLPEEIDTQTAVLATLGVRFAFGQWEPGVAVTYPITLGSDADDFLDTSVYIHLDVAYRFD